MAATTVPDAVSNAISGAAAQGTTIVLGAVGVCFGLYALKPAWRIGKSVLGKLGF